MNKQICLLSIALIFSMCGCTKTGGSSNNSSMDPNEFVQYGDVMEDFIPEPNQVKLLFKHSLEETVGDDGEDYFYNYCPSLKVENGEMNVYYCTNKDWGNITDYIGYRKGKIDEGILKFKHEQLMFGPTPDTWDQRHTCDPSVIKGEFKYENETYNYLMAYLGCIPSDCTQNETGIAVAKSPDGPWIKCNGVKSDGVTKINPIVPYTDFDCSPSNWGTGQACVLSIDKKGRVLLLTSIGCRTGSFMDVREYDFSDINNYQLIRQSTVFTDGVEGGVKRVNNADYCYDPVAKKFYMAKGRSPYGSDGQTPNFIADTVDLFSVDASAYDNPFDIFFDSERTEKWHLVNSVDKAKSGYPRNHNTGLVTDEYGHMYKSDRIGVAFTSSQYGSTSAMTYLKTYRIFLITFMV